jgi:FAD:protein FMN transferase
MHMSTPTGGPHDRKRAQGAAAPSRGREPRDRRGVERLGVRHDHRRARRPGARCRRRATGCGCNRTAPAAHHDVDVTRTRDDNDRTNRDDELGRGRASTRNNDDVRAADRRVDSLGEAEAHDRAVRSSYARDGRAGARRAAGHERTGRAGAARGAHADDAAHHSTPEDDTADHRVRSAAPASASVVHGIAMPLTLNLDAGYWTEHRAYAMGSHAHLVVGDAPPGLARWALGELDRLEQCWSRFRSDSELARLHARPGEWTPVSTTMMRALTCAGALSRATDGRFDPTIRAALEQNGYDRSFELVPPSEPATQVGERAPGFGQVQIDREGARVRLPAGVRVDLGGVGKGLAADIVASGLVDRGARSALVSLGGDMRAYGEPPSDGAWHIPVEDPRDESRVAFTHDLATGGLVTSTTRMRAWHRGGRSYHHLIDPATGDSARTGVVAVVAAAPDAWWAEGIAKAVVVAGAEDGLALARRNRVDAWIFRDGQDGWIRS